MRVRPGLALVLAAAALVSRCLLRPPASPIRPSETAGRYSPISGNSEVLSGVAVQADGKVVAAGGTQELITFKSQFAIARYTSAGELDAGFGTEGKVMTRFGVDAVANAVALQPDCKIVAAGAAQPDDVAGFDFALARYNVDGTLDQTFGTGGRVLTDFGGMVDSARALAIQPDGKLVVAGRARPVGPPATSPGEFALARYNPDGTLDDSFGQGGKVSTDFAQDSDDWASGIALAPGGKIVVAGYRLNRPSFTGNIEVARYNADGTLDSSFSDDGKILNVSNGDSAALDVVVQPDGLVVVSGSVGPDLALVRYTSGGSLDSSFGAGGIGSTDFGLQTSGGYGLARQPDGKFVVAAFASSDAEIGPQSPAAFGVARFESDGQIDRTFYGGTVLTEIGTDSYDAASGVALQSDGKIIVAGFSAESAGIEDPADFALVRYLEPPAPVPSPPPGPPPASPPPPPPTVVRPPAAVRCVVPNVKRTTVARARRLLALKRCALGRAKRAYSIKVKKGTIISQGRRPGARLASGTRVNVVVSRGKRRAQTK